MLSLSVSGLRFIGLYFVFLPVFLIMLPGVTSAQADASAAVDEVDAKFGWLDDPSGDLSLQQAINRFEYNGFKPIGGSLSRGYTLSDSWLSLTLTASELMDFDYLWMEPSQLNEVDVYYQTGINASEAGNYLKLSLGDHGDSAEKPYLHFRMLFPLKSMRSYL
ncbi:7TMR-DISMED2 domain-containing protein [Oceanospirillum linum]|uniref:7TMR-DISMED2 domain-containing protein n=1 Tax=Oceanospirillum linum TaxID=966 RepID=UPI00089F4F9C|nr:7TM-DISM domain-containing protein [Oceanospirillum linum]SEG22861.1 7TMR-DISM extracellular 2 [Oleiphilus messinensis]SMP25441.1 7TMR-DISM extracellular 2 [Oceanospirillum linum]